MSIHLTREPWEFADDPEGFHDDMRKSQYHGCICGWEWKYTGHRSGYDKRDEKANCPYHKVMY